MGGSLCILALSFPLALAYRTLSLTRTRSVYKMEWGKKERRVKALFLYKFIYLCFLIH